MHMRGACVCLFVPVIWQWKDLVIECLEIFGDLSSIVVCIFLDQELISYRYSSCCCSSSSYWGRSLQKSLRLHHFKSDRDEI